MLRSLCCLSLGLGFRVRVRVLGLGFCVTVRVRVSVTGSASYLNVKFVVFLSFCSTIWLVEVKLFSATLVNFQSFHG